MDVKRLNRAQLDEMHVREANSIADSISGDTGKDEKGPTTQMGKAAKVAERCESPIVFEQWLRYQAGRNVPPWRERIGNQLIVDRVVEYQRRIAERVNQMAGYDLENRDKVIAKTIAAETARFLGFVRRALVAHTVKR